MPHISTRALIENGAEETTATETVEEADTPLNVLTARVMAILCQAMIVLGVLVIARNHFENTNLGLGAATLYLLLPYTALWTGNVTHALPAALLLWAVCFYRRPFIAGAFIGLGLRGDLLPVLAAAALDFVLPAAWLEAFLGGRVRDDRRVDRDAGLHLGRR